MPFQSRTFSGGGFGTRRDLDLRKEMALLRELEAQAAAKEQETRLADPYEAAKASETARQFMTRRDVREMLPPSGPPPLAAPSRTSPGASLMQSLPAALRNIRRIEPSAPAQPRIRTFKSAPTMTSQREEAEAVRDPNFATAYRGRELDASLDPRVLAEKVAGQTRIEAAKIAGQGSGQPSPYARERGVRNLRSVNELLGQVSTWTAGPGSMLAKIPGTAARNMKAELDTLKANIAFGELTAMREASKTGGALGQVAVRELELLESSLGSLDTGQSPANLARQLEKIGDSLSRWYDAEASSQKGDDSQNGSGATGAVLNDRYSRYLRGRR